MKALSGDLIKKSLLVIFALLAVLGLRACVMVTNDLRRFSKEYARNEELSRAALKGDSSQVRALLSQGANPNYCGDGSFVVLDCALQSEDQATILAVLTAKPDLSQPLIHAIYQNKPDYVRLLLDHGADPEAKSSDGMTALDIAKSVGYKDLVRILENATHGAKHE